MKKCLVIVVAFIFLLGLGIFHPTARAARARIPERVGTPYLGAIVVDEDTGEVFFKESADASFYPASIVKLMMLLIIQEKIEDGALNLSDQVRITAAAAGMGGSQVYLAENEVFPVEELLYAIMIQSANDAAVALAIHVAGSKEAFVDMMQRRADMLSMKDTEFHSVHGLPPAPGQKPDVSSPRDLAKLARELLKHPDILEYTSAQVRGFRNDTFEMRSHNRLLGTFQGCDGLKTGYFKAGGFSIVATAKRGDNRFVAVIAGSKTKSDRNSKARALLSKAFSRASSKASEDSPEPTAQLQSEIERTEMELEGPPPSWKTPAIDIEPFQQGDQSAGWRRTILIILLIAVLAIVFFWLGRLSRRPPPSSRFLLK